MASTIPTPTHRLNLTDAQWKAFQTISGKKNPGPYIDKVLNAHILTELIKDRPAVNEVSLAQQFVPVRPDTAVVNLDAAVRSTDTRVRVKDKFHARRYNLGCHHNAFDRDFTRAWAWACGQFGGEEQLIEHLEEQTALPDGARMKKPRAVVMARWNDAGRP